MKDPEPVDEKTGGGPGCCTYPFFSAPYSESNFGIGGGIWYAPGGGSLVDPLADLDGGFERWCSGLGAPFLGILKTDNNFPRSGLALPNSGWTCSACAAGFGGIGFLDAFSCMFSWSSLSMLVEARENESNAVVLVSLCNDVVGLGGFLRRRSARESVARCESVIRLGLLRRQWPRMGHGIRVARLSRWVRNLVDDVREEDGAGIPVLRLPNR
jgi:hypothetical protein